MSLSKHSIENLIDLVEIKIGALEIMDGEDKREMRKLQNCRDELIAMQTGIEMPRRRGRPKRTVPMAGNVVQLH